MPAALRLQGITLPVPDLAAAEKFYRWVLAMKEAAEESESGEAALGWGKEDRVRLLDASVFPGAREAISLRMEAIDPPAPGLFSTTIVAPSSLATLSTTGSKQHSHFSLRIYNGKMAGLRSG